MMIRAVFDTNVLISSFLGRGAPFEVLELVYEGKVRLITSIELFNEFISVIERDRFGLPKSLRERMTTVIYEISEFVEPKIRVDKISHGESDNRVLEAALEGKAEFIVSGDRHLLDLKRWRGIEILSAREFKKRLASD